MARHHEFFIGIPLKRLLQKRPGLSLLQIRLDVMPRVHEPAMEALIVRQGGKIVEPVLDGYEIRSIMGYRRQSAAHGEYDFVSRVDQDVTILILGPAINILVGYRGKFRRLFGISKTPGNTHLCLHKAFSVITTLRGLGHAISCFEVKIAIPVGNRDV